MRKIITIVSFLLLSCFLLFGQTTNGNFKHIRLEWDPSLDTNVIGYKVFYYSSVSTTNIHYAGNFTNTTLFDLIPTNSIYYFYVTCYDSTGIESDRSNIISFGLPKPDNSLWISEIMSQRIAMNTILSLPILVTNRSMLYTNIVFHGAHSTNETLISSNNIVLTGTGKDRILTITPNTNEFGITRIWFGVYDTNKPITQIGDYRARFFDLNVVGKPSQPTNLKLLKTTTRP